MNPVYTRSPEEVTEQAARSVSPAPTRVAPPTPPPSEPANAVVLALVPTLAGVAVGLAILLAMVLTLLGQAGGVAALGAALLGEHSAWYLSRASAFAAYVLLWWSMVLGLAITNRMARLWPGGPAAADLHEHASLLGLAFAVLHALVLLGDHYIGYTLPQILVPFASASYRPLWVGLGQIGLYLLALVTFSFYVRRWLGARAWRLIHFLSFAVFALALAHSVWSGTDSGLPWATWMYASTGASVLALTLYRIVVRRVPAPPRAPRVVAS